MLLLGSRRKEVIGFGILQKQVKLRVNVDGSFLGGVGKVSFGDVFRDSNGRVLFQFNEEVFVYSIVHTELLAFREGILVAAASH